MNENAASTNPVPPDAAVDDVLAANSDRFSGFAELYDESRPVPPPTVVELLLSYYAREDRPLVADLGCGTGLSTFIWLRAAREVTGIDPNRDMLLIAQQKLKTILKPPEAGEPFAKLMFVPAHSTKLPFTDESLDIVTCSQSFHWMEPKATLREVHRVLRKDGLFAAYDCDWPPVIGAEIERAYDALFDRTHTYVAQRKLRQRGHHWPKDEHLANIRASGLYRYAREIAFHGREQCDAARFISIALSQGTIQEAVKSGADERELGVDRFKRLVTEWFAGRTLPMWLSYRLRLGMK